MRSASLRYGLGPGSSITLTAETIKIRDKVIERFIDKPLHELTSFLNQALEDEPHEERRLGLIAARIYILRHRVDHIKEYNRDSRIEPLKEPTPRSMLTTDTEAETSSESDSIEEVEQHDPDALLEVITIETGEINGVRIPAGITITVNQEDANRLIENGKAALVQKDPAGQEAVSDLPATEPELAEQVQQPNDALGSETATIEDLPENESADIGDPGASPAPLAEDESADSGDPGASPAPLAEDDGALNK